MALPSPFRRKDKAEPVAAGQETDGLRTRARRRLIGAVVLLGIGIVAFPLLFETAPRPIPVDLPIEIPRKDAVAPLAVPASAPKLPAVAASAPAAVPAVAAKPDPAPPQPQPQPEPAAAKVEPVVSEPKPEPEDKADGKRAKALLEGKVQAAPAERWVVQIGAFAEDRTIRDARARAGDLGLRTFTQVVVVQDGERTRVRVGPFDGRDEADAAAAKLKKAGLPATVLKL